ncbi:LOB domain-containing protein 37-like [Rutidosis leptorrhynchoides]|uniref:LOB domain-containing protein 37-like n=1 Tax=Rutidosis leptorrhynchoides TaxID=125765 RepID=UPI003A99769F
MSCNGCRVLRKGCSDTCILRPCLQWIDSPEAQGHATVFVAKFFGRAGLMSFISAVPENQRPSLFQSLLFEAAGRTVNPVNGAVGLLWTGNWRVCQASVETVLRGGTLRPMTELIDGFPMMPENGDSSDPVTQMQSKVQKRRRASPDLDLNHSFPANKGLPEKRRHGSPSMNSDDSSVTTTCYLDGGFGEYDYSQQGNQVHLLNLFK